MDELGCRSEWWPSGNSWKTSESKQTASKEDNMAKSKKSAKSKSKVKTKPAKPAAKKPGGVKKAAKKLVKKAAGAAKRVAGKATRRGAAKPAKSADGPRQSWFDDESNKPLIDNYAQKLSGFMDAIADGHVDEDEISAQEKRLVSIMKEVEPELSSEQHAKVTQLLCELTAYDLMQMIHSWGTARPAPTTFQG